MAPVAAEMRAVMSLQSLSILDHLGRFPDTKSLTNLVLFLYNAVQFPEGEATVIFFTLS